jgi:2-succinyl-5-enolpyruvyl-6-hydroxy-3-cyclohexene-1-carboxylate synthase
MNPSTAQARVIVDELVRNGLRHAVLCPGSRNAPLSFALHEADQDGRLTLHVRIDERSAGFLALGLSRGLGHGPERHGRVAVVCTSGTAVANLHPATAEAAHTGEPIVLLTADRPGEMVGSGANQTTVQHGMFAPLVPTHAFPLAEDRAGQNGMWRGFLCRVLAETRHAPLHLNVPLREPLVPGDAEDWPEPLDGRAGGGPWTRVTAPERAPGEGADLLRHLPAKTLVLVGEAPWHSAAAAGEVARRMDWPLVVEPPGVGPRHALSSASLVLNSLPELPDLLAPEVVLLVGRPTLSRGVNRLLGGGVEVAAVCAPERWADAQYVASRVAPTLDAATVDALTEAEVDARSDPQWSAGWRKTNAAVAEVIRCHLAAAEWPTGVAVAGELLRALPAPATLFLGSSNAIRDVDLVTERRGDLTVLANRGLAGIDGAVSTALGAAIGVREARGEPVPGYALLGDLSFCHDANGLLIGPGEPRPDLTLVVNNDDGGGIFHLLEQGAHEYEGSFDRIFGTPHGADLRALCAGYGIDHTLAGSPEELRAALAPAPGIRVIEVHTDRHRLRTDREALTAAVRAAVEATH